MFLHLSVSHSVHREACVAGGMHGRGACVERGMHGRGACVAGETATAADGTHPTGMNSCLLDMIILYKFHISTTYILKKASFSVPFK